MRSRYLPIAFAFVLGWGACKAPAWALGPVTFQNNLSFYGDEEGFNGPYRVEQELLGQQLQSDLGVSTGPRTALEAGLFGDHPSAVDTNFNLKPILSFKYFTPTTRVVFGTLETRDRHGFLEPLEVETLEITRPVEYGLQWEESDGWLWLDLFLNWQQLNTPGNPEIFDYGGVTRISLGDLLDAELQYHGYHQGGKLYYVGVVNNYVPALGLKFHSPLGFLGTAEVSAFGMVSGNLLGPFLQVSQSEWGGGFYAKGSVTPWDLAQLYGIFWVGQDFFSWEGDANYNSQGLNGFYQSYRTYGELGLRKEVKLRGAGSLEGEVRASDIDGTWAFSGRLLASVALGVEVPPKGKGDSDAH